MTILLTCDSVLAQRDSPHGFEFQRNDKGDVWAIRYWGSSGLQSGGLDDFTTLEFLEIVYGTKLTADDLKYLSSLDQLEGLQIGQDLVDTPVHIEGDLSVLGKLKLLEHVHLCKHDIKDSDLEFISSLPALSQLKFNADSDLDGGGSTLTDRCATHICQAKTLESIYVQGYGNLTDEFVSTITDGLPELEHLNISCPNLTDASLKFLAKRCKELKWLDLGSNRITDHGVEHLSEANNLEMLWIESTSLTSRSIESVASLQKLRHLELTVPTIDDRHAQILADLRKLEIIALRKHPLTDKQFRKFANHPTLKSGFLNGENLSIDNTLKTIESIPNLRHLRVGSKNLELQSAIDRVLQNRSNTSH